ncbi:MAG: acyl carrier protein [Deltaproteobacteria bacterium RIFCSPLOWO2_02_FULL_47_10]|nr:MAG: acyl carrier protein [Deltaproteobacteria bacterium RIFCSPLOWO2_02_FULL_47_10]
MSAESKVKEIIAEQLGINEEDISPESSLTDDLGADSLDIFEVVMALEEEFELEISDEEVDKIDTVNNLIEIVTTKSC